MRKAKRIILIILAIIVPLLIIPLIINVLYKFDFGIELFRSEWSAGDALGYYGVVLGGIITVGGIWYTIRNERKKQLEENTIMYKPIIELVGVNKEINSGTPKRELNVGFGISVENNDEERLNHFFNQQQDDVDITRLIFKNKGRGETFNLYIDKLELLSNWEEGHQLFCGVSGVYIGEILQNNEFAVDITFPDYIFLPKKNLKGKDFIVQCKLMINYSDMFNRKKYQLVTFFNMHIEKTGEPEKDSPLNYNSKYAYYRVLWAPTDFGPERRIYSDKSNQYLHEYDYMEEQSKM